MRVVVIGIANQQTSVAVDSFPVEYVPRREVNGAIRHTVGGVGFNVARVLSALGNMVALASPLGEDYPAAMIDAEAYRYNISTHLCHRELKKTPRSVVIHDAEGRRMVNSDLTDGATFIFPLDALRPDVARANLVILANLPLTRQLVTPLRTDAALYAVDLHDVRSPLNPADSEFLQADFINMSNEHVRGREAEVLLELRAASAARLLSMTAGADGAYVLTREMDEPVHVPTSCVNAVSTVGAGEVYWAVLLHHHVKGQLDAVTAASMGCQAAARMISARPFPAQTDINDFRALLGVADEPEAAPSPPDIAWIPFEEVPTTS